MPHAMDANEFENSLPDDDPQLPAARFPWETIPRCLVVAGVLCLVALISWRPAMLRFSQLMFLVSPSHGDSLAWKPDPEPDARPEPRRNTVAPSEWRLAATHFGTWKPERTAESVAASSPADRLNGGDWQRLSFNPWNWQDDAPFLKTRLEAGPVDPDQQPLTAYKTKEDEVWTAPPAETASRPAPSTGPQMPSISPVPLEIPSLPSLELREAASAQAKADSAPVSSPEPSLPDSLLELPPLSFDDIDLANDDLPDDKPERREESRTAEIRPDEPAPSEPIPGIPVLAPVDVAADSAEPEKTEWADTEITGPIPGAYLTIYPKLKFVGLCVPGQGYVRKYNQIAAPKDADAPKTAAHDGRTPYGKYYVAGRTRDPDGPALVLSWPSPEDAIRIGLPEDQLKEIEAAWLSQSLPPQDTEAGGELTLNSSRDRVEETEGDFSLELPHMEEINTALPDGAWVFIQQ